MLTLEKYFTKKSIFSTPLDRPLIEAQYEKHGITALLENLKKHSIPKNEDMANINAFYKKEVGRHNYIEECLVSGLCKLMIVVGHREAIIGRIIDAFWDIYVDSRNNHENRTLNDVMISFDCLLTSHLSILQTEPIPELAHIAKSILLWYANSVFETRPITQSPLYLFSEVAVRDLYNLPSPLQEYNYIGSVVSAI